MVPVPDPVSAKVLVELAKSVAKDVVRLSLLLIAEILHVVRLRTLSLTVLRAAAALASTQSVSSRLARRHSERAERRRQKGDSLSALSDLDAAVQIIRSWPSTEEQRDRTLVEILARRLDLRRSVGNWAGAAQDATALIAANPSGFDLEEIYLGRADAEGRLGQTDDAIDTLSQANERFGSDAVRDELYDKLFARAKANYGTEDWSKTIPDVQRMLELTDESTRLITLHVALASLYELIGDFDAARVVLVTGLRAFPTDSVLRTCMSRLMARHLAALLGVQDWGSLIVVASHAIDWADHRDMARLSELYSLRAQAHFFKGEHEAAITDATTALQHDAARQMAYVFRGWAKVGLGLTGDAILDFSDGIERGDEWVRQLALQGRASTRQQVGDHEKAVHDCLTLIDGLGSTSAEDYRCLAASYLALRLYGDAIARLTQFLDRAGEPANAVLLCRRADAYRLSGKYAEALDDYRRAINLNSSLTDGYYGCALAMIDDSDRLRNDPMAQRRQLHDAIEYLRRVVEVLSPRFVAAWYHLAGALSKAGDHEEARESLNRVRTLQRETPTSGAQATRFGIAELWRLLNTPGAPDVSDDLEHVARNTPTDALAQLGAGYSHFRANRLTEALNYFTRAAELDPTLASAYAWRGLTRVSLGDWLAAKEDAATARSHDPNLALAWAVKGFSHYYSGPEGRADAISALQRAIELDPEYVAPYRYAAAVFIEAKEWEQAHVICSRAIGRGIKDLEVLVFRAEARRWQQDTDGCIKDCSDALLLAPGYWSALYVRGLALAQGKHGKAALQDLKAALDSAPEAERATVRVARAEAYMAAHDLGAAVQELTTALEFDPVMPSALHLRAWVYLQRNDLDAAERDFTALSNQRDMKVHAYVGLSEMKRLRGKLQDAMIDANRALVLEPGLHAAYGARARVHFDLADWDAAIADLTRALDGAPDPSLDFILAESRRMKNEFDAAVAAYTRAIGAGYEPALTYSRRGVAEAERDNWDAALADLSEAVRRKPDSSEFLGLLSWVHFGLGNWAEVVRTGEQVLTLKGDSAEILTRVGQANAFMGRFEEAISCFTRLTAKQEFEGRYMRGWAHCLAGRNDAGLKDLNDALRINPEDGYAYSNRAWAYNRTGRWALAAADLTDALKFNPTLEFSHFDRALARFHLGDASGALEDFSIELKSRLGSPVRVVPKRLPESRILWRVEAADWDPAVVQYQEHAFPWLGRGFARWMARDLEGALEDASSSLTRTKTVEARLLRGLILLEMGRHEDAEAEAMGVIDEAKSYPALEAIVAATRAELKNRQRHSEMPPPELGAIVWEPGGA